MNFLRLLQLLVLLTFITAQGQLENAQYSIKNLVINTPYSDLGTSFWGRGRIIYSSSVNSKTLVEDYAKLNDKSKPFLEVFTAFVDAEYELVHPKKVTMNFEVDFNQSNVAFSKDLQTVYFTLNNQEKTKSKVVQLKLYRAKVQKTGEWTDLEELPFNSNSYSCAHPNISDDGTKLYFSSNMPGGYGDTDLYEIDIHEDGTFGKPNNLGGYINSSAKENFPEINNGLLYFTSNRKGGMGGLDIYMVPTDNLFLEPVLLPEPINSKYDDFSFVINGDSRRGYFTSNRPQGKGGEDIYAFFQETAIKSCTQTIDVSVIDKNTEEFIKEAEINIFDDEGKWLNRFVTDEEGKFKIKLNKCDKNYKLEATKEEYSKDQAKIIYEPDKKEHSVLFKIAKDPTAVAKVEQPENVLIPDEKVQFIPVKNIEFLLNKYDVGIDSAEELDKVVNFMKKYPTTVVEFSAHTDSRGPDDWNMELTNLRAEEVIRYIIGKGIDYKRIYGKGYGETMPLNHCINGVECSEAEHLQNRRTEFLILAR